MTDLTNTDLDSLDRATPEELTEIITELEQYRERLVNDTLSMAQRAKIMKAQAMASLEPSLAQIDGILQTLRQKQAALTANR
jgi:exonuclease VII small subunit